jgi:hypothetical protein
LDIVRHSLLLTHWEERRFMILEKRLSAKAIVMRLMQIREQAKDFL